MKREIEFRGKTDKGEWVYGSFINSVVKGSPFGYIAGNNVVEPIQVMRKTVGQYTGLTDKNGKKIFEHDKVKFTDTTFGYSHIGEVCFDKGSFCILYEFYGQKELDRIGQTDKWQDMGASGTITYEYEVIDNEV